MYLGERLELEEETYPLCGVLSFSTKSLMTRVPDLR
jgi:hypothetical protein